ncbi:hypothetical protein vBYenSP400_12 [Yersinia phage vB_YenS_P400]|nr:hypothetical protein vBYenSP400_12 [Yersinia phage vB_YenS_P400]
MMEASNIGEASLQSRGIYRKKMFLGRKSIGMGSRVSFHKNRAVYLMTICPFCGGKLVKDDF